MTSEDPSIDPAAYRTCPACGGSGGGPFGRAGGPWDKDDYECPRCAGLGVLGLPVIAVDDLDLAPEEVSPVSRPGVAKTTPAKQPAKQNDRKRAAGEDD
ncbi:MAG: hypothetical protein JWM74_5230 [Myxococcaceae bacterium]|nr:hypothetical protein [Myxococcaceae bacterium]